MSGKGIYDIHCHIVPGVDDGATDIEETGKLLRMEYEQGVRTIIATPHFRFRMFETSAEKVKEQFKLVEKAAAEVASDLHVYLGCEFHTNMEMISMLRENKVMTMAGSRYVLTEFSHNSEENYIRERLSTLLSGGYKPIVAHIERYEATRTSMEFAKKCREVNLLLVKMRTCRLKEIIAKLNQILIGYYHYYGITDNTESITAFRYNIMRSLFYCLNRRSQKKSYNWVEFLNMLDNSYPLVRPRIYVNIYE